LAKVGNEVKLILSLANERAEKQVDYIAKRNGNSEYYAGYRDAKNWIFAEFAQTCMNLEQGK